MSEAQYTAIKMLGCVYILYIYTDHNTLPSVLTLDKSIRKQPEASSLKL